MVTPPRGSEPVCLLFADGTARQMGHVMNRERDLCDLLEMWAAHRRRQLDRAPQVGIGEAVPVGDEPEAEEDR